MIIAYLCFFDQIKRG